MHIKKDRVDEAEKLTKVAPQFIPDVRAGILTIHEALAEHDIIAAPAYFAKKRKTEKRKRLDKRTQQVKDYLTAVKAVATVTRLITAQEIADRHNQAL